MTQKPTARDQFAPVAGAYLTSAVHANPNAMDSMVALVQPQGGTVLDIGTGAGHTAYAFAPHVNQVVAFDMTPEMLAIVEEQAKAKNLSNITTQQGDAHALPFADSSFDGVTCRLCAHHFQSVPLAIAEVHRVLKPGGWALLVDTVGPESQPAHDQVNEIEELRDPSHIRNLRPSEWVETFADAGLVVKCYELHRKRMELPDWYDRMRVPAETRITLDHLIQNATDHTRHYLQPASDGFDLWEITLLAHKPK